MVISVFSSQNMVYFEQFLPQNKNHVRIAIKKIHPRKKNRWLRVPETPEPLSGLPTK
jgi:hypothetical protein